MTRSIKVGDKVRVVRAFFARGYKNGDILTVTRVHREGGVNVKECAAGILFKEIELIEPIRVGDTVTLIDDFYNHKAFKADRREIRKDISEQAGKELKVNEVYGDRVYYHASGEGMYTIPLKLLRKVEDDPRVNELPDLDKLTPMARGPHPEIKAGTKFVCVKDNLDFKRGETVTLDYNDNTSMPMFKPGGWALWENFAPLEPTKHRFTDEQVAEAQRIIGEIVAGFKIGECFFLSDESDKEIAIRNSAETSYIFHTFTAHCSPHDEFNRTIGVMVALCKAVGRKLPDWL